MKLMKMVSVDEGLNGYQTIKWINHHLQQRDLNLINQVLLSRLNVIETLQNYTGWDVFWNSVKPNSLEIQKTL